MQTQPSFYVPQSNYWNGNQFVIPGVYPGFGFVRPAPVVPPAFETTPRTSYSLLPYTPGAFEFRMRAPRRVGLLNGSFVDR